MIRVLWFATARKMETWEGRGRNREGRERERERESERRGGKGFSLT